YLQTLADTTGLDVAVLTSDMLLAGSRGVRVLFQPPHVRPPGQHLAPVSDVQRLGDATFIAGSDALRSGGTIQVVRPAPTPVGVLPGREPPASAGTIQGAPVVATLFVGMNEDDALAGLPAVLR